LLLRAADALHTLSEETLWYLFVTKLLTGQTFSKLKAFLRRAGARTREALLEAIMQALLTVTSKDAYGWFRHCGYNSFEERKS
jgi:hypothetical protein